MLRRQEPREQDRADADQPADRPLGEAEDEEADEIQDDQQDRPCSIPWMKSRYPRMPPCACPPRRRSRARVAAAYPRAARRSGAHAVDVGARGAVRSGQVRKRAPTSAVEPGDDRRDGRVDLRLGQRPLVVAQGQPVGEALVAVGQRPAAVDVEQGHVAEQGPPWRRIGASTLAAAVSSRRRRRPGRARRRDAGTARAPGLGAAARRPVPRSRARAT